jgi:hypothetical protein
MLTLIVLCLRHTSVCVKGECCGFCPDFKFLSFVHPFQLIRELLILSCYMVLMCFVSWFAARLKEYSRDYCSPY